MAKNNEDDDIKKLEKRIKALEDDTDYQQIKSLKNEINLRVGGWERFSKWYYSVVTFIVLAFIATLSLAIGFFGRNIVENWAKKDATQYIEERTKSSLEFNDLYSRGAGEFLDTKYEKAIDSFTRALDKAPDDASASYTHNYLGAAYRNVNKIKKALEEYNKSIRLKSDNPLSYTNRAHLYRILNQEDEAYKDYNMAKELIREEKDEKLKVFYNEEIERLNLRELEEVKK
jgi:tetratricopeptide (TPR) repeat protein